MRSRPDRTPTSYAMVRSIRQRQPSLYNFTQKKGLVNASTINDETRPRAICFHLQDAPSLGETVSRGCR